MKEIDMKSQTSRRGWETWVGCATAALLLIGTIAGCSTTEQASVQKPVTSGFLGDTSMLTPGDKEQASLRYVNPAAPWTKYNKVLLEPVTFWGDDKTKISAKDQQMLCNFLQEQLYDQLGKKFQMVNEPGEGVMRFQVALVDAESATPILRTVSMVIPQARLLSSLKFLATGTYPFIGGAQAEAKMTDSVTGQLLGEWIDKRVGGGSIKTAAQWEWGDAENAMKEWANQAATKLSSWTSGAVKPS
jgi:Protein of unknown function (DUF3313)